MFLYLKKYKQSLQKKVEDKFEFSASSDFVSKYLFRGIQYNKGFIILPSIVSSLTNIIEKKITEEAIKRIGEQVKHSQRMESIGTLAGGIAHDFNNILAIILRHFSLIEMKMNDP